MQHYNAGRVTQECPDQQSLAEKPRSMALTLSSCFSAVQVRDER